MCALSESVSYKDRQHYSSGSEWNVLLRLRFREDPDNCCVKTDLVGELITPNYEE